MGFFKEESLRQYRNRHLEDLAYQRFKLNEELAHLKNYQPRETEIEYVDWPKVIKIRIESLKFELSILDDYIDQLMAEDEITFSDISRELHEQP